MTWTVLLALAAALAVTLVALLARRQELAQMHNRLEERGDAINRGSHKARLQYPSIDLSKCIGCGTCVQACPEEGVLDLIHGQALVIHGARCVGHGKCASECPVGAIALTLGDLSQRKDIPVLEENFESSESQNLFLAGEVTGFALIRTAIEHGRSVAAEVAKRKKEGRLAPTQEHGVDLLIIGAGPAGLACALEARRHALKFQVIEQDSLGGTVAKYPRRKLVMTQPVTLPLAGKFERSTYEKEELMERWEAIAKEYDLPIANNVRYKEIVSTEQGLFRVDTTNGPYVASSVCLALGRRGTPRKLGVPGEDLTKVSYSLIDAQSYQGQNILVVGGGDSAVEAAMGLAEQPGNQVTLSYRGSVFNRIKARNEARLRHCQTTGKINVLLGSNLTCISENQVELSVADTTDDSLAIHTLANDVVFILAGGIPPFKLLEQAGVSFQHKEPDAEDLVKARGVGLVPALAFALLFTVGALLWYLYHADYYGLAAADRPSHILHDQLRPSGGFGLLAGVAGAGLILLNLSYLARRSQKIPWSFGSLQKWMTSHVATGILTLVAAILHSAFAPQDTVGGHALIGLGVLVCTGAMGRYLYSFVPHAANGRELELEEVRADLTQLSAAWDREHRGFGQEVQREIDSLIQAGRWTGILPLRILALMKQQWQLRRSLRDLRKRGKAEDLPPDQLQRILVLARKAHWNALLATNFEEVRSVLAGWRYLHKWAALLMVLLLVVHVVTAMRYATLPSWLQI